MKPIGVREGYDLWSETYDAFDNWLVAMTNVAMQSWQPEGRRVLELGCGTGRNAPFFLERGFDYVGVDVSAGMLRRAAERVVHPRARFVESEAHAGPFLAEHDFDGVFLSLVLEHVEDPAPMLAAAGSAAREGAWLRIFDIHPMLRAKGKQAHFEHDGEEHHFPSFAHDAEALARAMAPAWRIVSATSWYADAAASTKLARYAGEPVMLDVRAVRT